jgi:ribosome-binding protein aMBF1 (putative translation factor)
MALTDAFGRAVRRRREAVGWSQERLAQRSKVSRNFVGSVERGEQSLTLVVAARIAKALGIKLSMLVADAERER